jgi:putative oxidoreductase
MKTGDRFGATAHNRLIAREVRDLGLDFLLPSDSLCPRQTRIAKRKTEGEMTDIPMIQKRIPALAWYVPFEPFAYAFIRFSTGAIIFVHGFARMFRSLGAAELAGLGHALGQSVGLIELVGGAMLALGLLTRPVAIILGLEWLWTALAVPVRPGSSWMMLGATPHYPAMVALFCLAAVLCGGGRYSLDRLIGKEF